MTNFQPASQVDDQSPKLTLQTVPDRLAWDQAAASLPDAHVLQSWDWGAFKERWGWTAERLVWGEAGQPVAAAQVLRRAIPGAPWPFLYVTKGPVLDYDNVGLVDQILAGLERYARQAGALFIKIDPDVVRYWGEPQANPPPERAGEAILDLLARRGWRFSPEQIQFRNTIIIDLAPEPEALLAAMKSKWRYNIRLAERRGVVIRSGTAADASAFYKMYAETAGRDGFLLRPAAYYREVWSRFMAADRAEMLLAVVEEEIVAGLILFVFAGTAWYMYGASTGRHRRLMPNHLLQWQAMQRARERGCLRYDMWGAPDVFDPSDGMWGVYRFKQGFGGQVRQGIGAFDYPVRPALYRVFTEAVPRLRSLLRRIKIR